MLPCRLEQLDHVHGARFSCSTSSLRATYIFNAGHVDAPPLVPPILAATYGVLVGLSSVGALFSVPTTLSRTFRTKVSPRVFFAGGITAKGVLSCNCQSRSTTGGIPILYSGGDARTTCRPLQRGKGYRPTTRTFTSYVRVIRAPECQFSVVQQRWMITVPKYEAVAGPPAKVVRCSSPAGRCSQRHTLDKKKEALFSHVNLPRCVASSHLFVLLVRTPGSEVGAIWSVPGKSQYYYIRRLSHSLQ